MVEKTNYYDELLIEFQDIVKEKYNVEVNFSEKKMVQDYCEILDDNLDFVLYNEVLTSGVLANYFKVLYSNKFMVHNDQLYKYNGVYWCLD